MVTWPGGGVVDLATATLPATTGLPLIQTGTVSSLSSAGLFIGAILLTPRLYRNGAHAGTARRPRRSHSSDGTPYSEAFGDVYHSAAGGLAQARHVFLGGNGLPGRWAGPRALRHPRDRLRPRPEFPRDLAGVAARPAALRAAALRLDREASVLPAGPPDASRAVSGVRRGSRRAARALAAARPGRAPPRARQRRADAVLRRHQGRCATCASPPTRSTSTASRRRRIPTCGRRRCMRSLSRLAAPGATAATWSVAGAGARTRWKRPASRSRSARASAARGRCWSRATAPGSDRSFTPRNESRGRRRGPRRRGGVRAAVRARLGGRRSTSATPRRRRRPRATTPARSIRSSRPTTACSRG